MAMLPFCGYDMGEYFAHWLRMQERLKDPPPMFLVNWFRKDSAGKFLWPGYGENMRVLQWVLARARGEAGARETVVGSVPRDDDLDLGGLDMPRDRLAAAMAVDRDEWRTEVESQGELFDKLDATMPAALRLERQLLQAKL
jgi:phosphoenolpyruvate carboxykinase (GTP)